MPRSVVGSADADRQTLVAQLASVQPEVARRVARLTTLPTATSVDDRRNLALAQLHVVFGDGFLVLPRFTASNAAELVQAFGDSTKIQGNDPLASATWFHRMARLRDGVARLQSALDYSEALGNSETLHLALAQLPYRAGDRWVALPECVRDHGDGAVLAVLGRRERAKIGRAHV